MDRKRVSKIIFAVLLVSGLQLADSPSKAESISTFDVPGSTCLARFNACTTPVSINNEGDITGFYADANAALHSFLRTKDGMFIKFDPPGAACIIFFPGFGICSFAGSINAAEMIAGSYYDDNGNGHGFLRTVNGVYTTVDPPGSIATFVCFFPPLYAGSGGCINDAGAITGFYNDANGVQHGFVRVANGGFTTVDPPGSTGTQAVGVNPAGAITGSYGDQNFMQHGFVRDANGIITSFDPPGSIYTKAYAINPAGAITGIYFDANSVQHGFVRDTNGGFTTFDGPVVFQTSANSINPAGVITGGYNVGQGVVHGFVRDASGTITSFDPPDSFETFPLSINPAGVITGQYIDPSFLGHGFIRSP